MQSVESVLRHAEDEVADSEQEGLTHDILERLHDHSANQRPASSVINLDQSEPDVSFQLT